MALRFRPDGYPAVLHTDRITSATVRAPRREVPCRHAEDVSQSLDLLDSKSSLSAIAAAFGGAHGGSGGLAHQLAGFCLCPPFAQPKSPHVRAGNCELLLRDFIGTAPPPRVMYPHAR